MKLLTIQVWNWLTCKRNRREVFIPSFESGLCPACVRNLLAVAGPAQARWVWRDEGKGRLMVPLALRPLLRLARYVLEPHWAQLDGALRADDFTDQEAVVGGAGCFGGLPFLAGAGVVPIVGERVAAGMA